MTKEVTQNSQCTKTAILPTPMVKLRNKRENQTSLCIYIDNYDYAMDEGAKSPESIQVTWESHRSEQQCLEGDNGKKSRTAMTDVNDHYREHFFLVTLLRTHLSGSRWWAWWPA